MRVTLGSVAALALAAAVCASCGDGAVSQAQASAEPEGELIKATGCVTPGPQPNCMTIKYKGSVYDVSAASPAVDPSRGVAVSLQGRAKGATTACGAKLDDIKYDYLGIRCAAPAPAPAQAG